MSVSDALAIFNEDSFWRETSGKLCILYTAFQQGAMRTLSKIVKPQKLRDVVHRLEKPNVLKSISGNQ
jgi:hypothetical protein